MTFRIEPIEFIALRKLELVSKVLATKLSDGAGQEQQCLADTLGKVLDRWEIERHRVPAPRPTPLAGGRAR